MRSIGPTTDHGTEMHVLDTERLRLRWLGPGDAGLILELTNDPGWLRHIGARVAGADGRSRPVRDTVIEPVAPETKRPADWRASCVWLGD